MCRSAVRQRGANTPRDRSAPGSQSCPRRRGTVERGSHTFPVGDGTIVARARAPLGVERCRQRRVGELDQLSVVEEPHGRRNLQYLTGPWLQCQNEIVAAVDAGPVERKLSAQPVLTEAHDASPHVRHRSLDHPRPLDHIGCSMHPVQAVVGNTAAEGRHDVMHLRIQVEFTPVVRVATAPQAEGHPEAVAEHTYRLPDPAVWYERQLGAINSTRELHLEPCSPRGWDSWRPG